MGRFVGRWTRSVLIVAALVVGVGGALPTAEARRARRQGRVSKERRTARKLVKQGVAKLREGDYVAALELFTRAFKIYPSPKIQFNIAQTYKELGRFLDAIGAYETFIAKAPGDTSKALLKLARDNIGDLLRKIAVLRIGVSVAGARVSIDGKPRGVSPLAGPIRLMPGAHSVVVKAEGYLTAVQDVRVEPNQRRTLEITLTKPRAKVVKVIYRTLRKPKKGLPLLWAGLAVTGAAGIAAAVMGGLALAAQKRMDDLSLPIAEREEAQRSGKRYQMSTDGLLIGAGVLAVGTLVWYLVVVRPSGGTERVRVDAEGESAAVLPTLGPGGAGLTFRW